MLRFGLWTGLAIGVLIGTFSLLDTTAFSRSEPAFERTWERTDRPVAAGRAHRTWMWGPSSNTEAFYERYSDAPDGERLVAYFEKSRMEVTNPDADPDDLWYVTNGLLARELITGEMQTGDTAFEQREPAGVQVAGDNHLESPTYATFRAVLDEAPLNTDSVITQTIDRTGAVGDDADLAQYQVYAQQHVAETGHTVASVFWEFMNSTGEIYVNGEFHSAPLFENPFFAVGLPITEAYWMHVPVDDEWQDVLAQCFERRCLTYTPANPDGWKVEAGNIGQHYYTWRYEQETGSPESTATPPVSSPEPTSTAEPLPTPPSDPAPPPVESPTATPVPTQTATPPPLDGVCGASEQAQLIQVTDGLGNTNPNSWARGTGGDWPGGLEASPSVSAGDTLTISAQGIGECPPLEYRFQRHRPGVATEVVRDWSGDPGLSYTFLETDFGQYFMIIVDVRDQDPRTRFDHRDDYTYLTYIVD